MHVASPAHIATHAYVNPVIAVLLGWLIGGEALTTQIALAATGIVIGVILMVSDKPGKRVTAEEIRPLVSIEMIPESVVEMGVGKEEEESCAAG